MANMSSSTNEILQRFCSTIKLHANDENLMKQRLDEVVDFLIQVQDNELNKDLTANEGSKDRVQHIRMIDDTFGTDTIKIIENITSDGLHLLTTITRELRQSSDARKYLVKCWKSWGETNSVKKLYNIIEATAAMLYNKWRDHSRFSNGEDSEDNVVSELTEQEIMCYHEISLALLMIFDSNESIDKYFNIVFDKLRLNLQIDALTQVLDEFVLVLTKKYDAVDDNDSARLPMTYKGNSGYYYDWWGGVLNYLGWYFNGLLKFIPLDMYNNPTIHDHRFFRLIEKIIAKSLSLNVDQETCLTSTVPYVRHPFWLAWGQWVLKMDSMISPILPRAYYFEILGRGQLMKINILSEMLDEVCQVLTTSSSRQQTRIFSSNELALVTQIILALKSPHIANKLTDPKILKHQFFQLIQDIFHKLSNTLYSNWKILTTEEIDCLSTISSLIYHMLPYTGSTHKDYLNHLLFQSSSFDQLCQTIQNLSKNEYEPDNIQYKSIGSLIQIYGRCYYTPLVNEFRNQLELLLNPIAECIRSTFYLNAIQKWSWDERSRFYVQKCPLYIIHYSQKRQGTISDTLCSRILIYSEQIFDRQLEKILDISSNIESITFHMELLNFLAMFPSSRKLFTKHISIINTIITILNSYNTYAKKFGQKLIGHCSILLYNLTFDKILFSVIKSKNLTSIFDQLSDASDDSIQFGIRSLKNILDKKTIDDDDKTNAAIVTQAYTEILSKAVEDPSQISHGVSLPTILNSMKTLTQNEYVTKEIISQEKSLELLTKCGLDKKFDIQQVQKPALETIRIITFEPESKGPLKQHPVFIEHLKVLVVSPNDPILQKVANGIMWNMENQQKFIDAQDATHRTVKKKVSGVETIIQEPIIRSTEFEFDIMMSYCHKNKDLCHQIHDRLQIDYKVWIDKEGMYGSTIEAMAEAIENSSVILICMSEDYRKSDDCRAEVIYARKRKQRLLPIKVQRKYEPSGWLGFIIEDKMYIDFGKHEFDVAYVELKRHLDNSLNRDTRSGRKTVSKVYYEKSSLTDWTRDDVNKFFTDHRMEQAATAFADFDGPHLLDLYLEYSKQSQDQVPDWIKRTPLSRLSMLDFHTIYNELSAFIPQSKKAEEAKTCAIS